MNKIRYNCLVLIIFMVICFLPTNTFADNVEQGGESFFKITGHVVPDFMYSDYSASINKAGFKVEVPETDLFTVTDQYGYYELNIPVYQSVYAIKVSKSNYLEREIKPLVISKDNHSTEKPEIEFTSVPITSDSVIDGIIMWPGDIKIDGIQDSVINMCDIMKIAKHFNSTSGSKEFSVDADLNCDNSINLSDVMLLVKHFNRSKKDYLDPVSMAKTIENALKNYYAQASVSEPDTRNLFYMETDANSVIRSLQQQIDINGKIYGPYLDSTEIYVPIFMIINGENMIADWNVVIDCKNKQFYVTPSYVATLVLIGY